MILSSVTYRPSTDIAVSWVRNTGATNASCVDDVIADEDVTRVSTATLNNIDEYGYMIVFLPFLPQARILDITFYCRGKAVDPMGISPWVRCEFGLTDGVNYFNFNTGTNFGTTYSTLQRTLTNNPLTNTYWTSNEATQNQYIKLIAKKAGSTARITQLYQITRWVQDTRPGRCYVSWTP